MTRFFSSDHHFFHPKIAELRGFSSVEEHDERLIQIHNSVVRKDDFVVFCGDFTVDSAGKNIEKLSSVVGRLNGDLHLVLGNHDAGHPLHKDGHKYMWNYYVAGFKSVSMMSRVKIGGRSLLISHFPYEGDHTPEDRHTQYRLRNEGLTLIHGHTHKRSILTYAEDTLQIHVGVDAHDMYPVHEDVIECLSSLTVDDK